MIDVSFETRYEMIAKPSQRLQNYITCRAKGVPYCIQVKLVGRREVKNESQGEERNSSWKFVLRSVNAL